MAGRASISTQILSHQWHGRISSLAHNCVGAARGLLALTMDPWINHFDATSFKARCVSGGDRSAASTRDSRYLAVLVVDGPSRHSPTCRYCCVCLSGRAIEWQDASRKVFSEHRFHRRAKTLTPLTSRQYLNSVAQLRLAYSRKVKALGILADDPFDYTSGRPGTHQFRYDISVQDYH